ncbi:MAG: type II toxin-antitoxin system VapC family toxin [Gammaproteobacteria bacterium]|nr:type II toxin-antitoxin system VapC family toxin [Gammaproteobacteria bacterium]
MVVDTNVVAYYWIPGPFNGQAVTLRVATDDWLVPRLWRSEFRNVLAGFLRGGHLRVDEAKALAVAAEAELLDFERDVDSTAVIDLVASSRLSAYDCEFVALARSLGIALVTEDAAILEQFPEVAVSMEAFAE